MVRRRRMKKSVGATKKEVFSELNRVDTESERALTDAKRIQRFAEVE